MKYDYLFLFTVVTFYIWSLRSIFYWIKLWQNVRYQSRSFFHSDQVKRRIYQYLFSFSSLLSWLAIVGALYITFDDKPLLYYQFAVFAIFLLKTVIVIKDVITSRFLYPAFSLRSSLIMLSSVFTLSLFFMYPLVENFLWLLILDRVLFFIVNGFVFFYSFPGEILDDLQIKKAIARLHKQKNSTFILIIGSSEAGNVSHFLTQVLKPKQKVFSLHDEVITQSQLASEVMQKIQSPVDSIIITVEKPSDISWMKFFFTPDIVVLFDSPELTSTRRKAYLSSVLSLVHKKTKLYLDAPLEPYLHGKRSKQLLSLFSSNTTQTLRGERVIRVSEVTQKKSFLDLTLALRSTTMTLRTPLLGLDFQISLLLTAALVHSLGYTQKEIKSEFLSLLPHPRKRVYHESPQGVTFIDNTGNMDITEIPPLLNYMARYKKSRIVIFGKESVFHGETSQSRKLLASLASIATHVLLLPHPHRAKIKQYIKQKNSDCTVRELTESQVYMYIKDHVRKGDLILLEGEDCAELSHQLYNTYATHS